MFFKHFSVFFFNIFFHIRILKMAEEEKPCPRDVAQNLFF